MIPTIIEHAVMILVTACFLAVAELHRFLHGSKQKCRPSHARFTTSTYSRQKPPATLRHQKIHVVVVDNPPRTHHSHTECFWRRALCLDLSQQQCAMGSGKLRCGSLTFPTGHKAFMATNTPAMIYLTKNL